jgi:hypothetical protein
LKGARQVRESRSRISQLWKEEVIMMKNALLFVLLASLVAVMSCATSQTVTNFWKSPDVPQGKVYTSVFIMAITPDMAARNLVESDLAAAATSKGFKATRSVDVFPSSFTKDNVPAKEEMLAKIRELNCDAVFTVSMLDMKSEQRYVPGTTTYATTGYGGMGYAPYPYHSYYGSYYSYASYSVPVVSTPGYYTTDKTYFIEGNLYDAGTEQIRWSMQSTAYNPSSLSSFSKGYAKLLIGELEKHNAK